MNERDRVVFVGLLQLIFITVLVIAVLWFFFGQAFIDQMIATDFYMKETHRLAIENCTAYNSNPNRTGWCYV